MGEIDTFELGLNVEQPVSSPGPSFIVDLDGYEGPVDVLLSLAREQKVDLTQISILALADQYLAFMHKARQSNLDLAADYLVMAAWLAYLKSRLLLPDIEDDDEPSGEEMASALQFQLQRLEAMQEAGAGLMGRDQLNRNFFPKGSPEKINRESRFMWDVTLYDLLKAYGDSKCRGDMGSPLHIEAFEIYTVENALSRLRGLLGNIPSWQDLWSYLPDNLTDGLLRRSAIASTFAASLELAKEGKIKISQAETFGAMYVKDASEEEILEFATEQEEDGHE